MTRLHRVALTVVVGLLVAAGTGAQQGGSQAGPGEQLPTFRGGVNAVTVDASVRDKSRRPVTGLTARDFQVFDNGVLQTVDTVSFGRLPIDVTVALDISYSVSGTLLERLRRGVIDLMDDLRKEDRLKLVLFNMRVNRTVDFTSDVREVERALKGVTAGGGTALLDAISVALVAARQPDRRQLIVVFTDGSDSSSSTTPDMLTRVAERTPGTLTFVMPTVAPAITIRQGNSVTRIGGLRPSRRWARSSGRWPQTRAATCSRPVRAAISQRPSGAPSMTFARRTSSTTTCAASIAAGITRSRSRSRERGRLCRRGAGTGTDAGGPGPRCRKTRTTLGPLSRAAPRAEIRTHRQPTEEPLHGPPPGSTHGPAAPTTCLHVDLPRPHFRRWPDFSRRLV